MPATCSIRTGNASTRKASPSTCGCSCPIRTPTTRRRRSSSRTGTASSGSRSRPRSLESAPLGELILPPEAGDKYTAKYDIELWGWSGGIDPNGLLQIFRCEEIGTSSDSQYCNPAYDQMYADQLKAPTAEARKAILAQMQNLIYDKAVYDILYYDANTEALSHRPVRRLDRTSPSRTATPFFTYSTLEYTKLTDAKARADPGAVRGGGGVRPPGASRRPPRRRPRSRVPPRVRRRRDRSDSVRRRRSWRVVVALVAVVAVGLVLVQPSAERRRGRGRGRVTGSARFGGPPAPRPSPRSPDRPDRLASRRR